MIDRKHVIDELGRLYPRERKLSVEARIKLVAGRITKGWSFLEQSAESHEADVRRIAEIVKEHLQ